MPNKVLIAGASGLLGVAAIEAFLSAGWDVVGVSRRKPELLSGRDFSFLSVDLLDDEVSRTKLAPLDDITHIAYAAIHEDSDELVHGWSDPAVIEQNNRMLRNVVEPIAAADSPPSSATATNDRSSRISTCQCHHIYGGR